MLGSDGKTIRKSNRSAQVRDRRLMGRTAAIGALLVLVLLGLTALALPALAVWTIGAVLDRGRVVARALTNAGSLPPRRLELE
jgi:hypothetical protein